MYAPTVEHSQQLQVVITTLYLSYYILYILYTLHTGFASFGQGWFKP